MVQATTTEKQEAQGQRVRLCSKASTGDVRMKMLRRSDIPTRLWALPPSEGSNNTATEDMKAKDRRTCLQDMPLAQCQPLSHSQEVW